jgi:hypothetical protein
MLWWWTLSIDWTGKFCYVLIIVSPLCLDYSSPQQVADVFRMQVADGGILLANQNMVSGHAENVDSPSSITTNEELGKFFCFSLKRKVSFLSLFKAKGQLWLTTCLARFNGTLVKILI